MDPGVEKSGAEKRVVTKLPWQVNAARQLTLEDLNFNPPEFPEEYLHRVALEAFGLRGSLRKLDGERDQNHLLCTADGQRFVLKVSGLREREAVVDFQVQALLHLAETDPSLPVPRLVQTLRGDAVYRLGSVGGEHAVRLLTWLPGIPYEQGPAPSVNGLQCVGNLLGRLNRALKTFRHPAAHHFMPWDIGNGLIFNAGLLGLLSENVRAFLSPVLRRLEQQVFPCLPMLPTQVIHQDGHGGNLLRPSVADESAAGLIDFGDMIQGPLICDLAASASHFIEAGRAPVEVAVAMVQGFREVIALSEQETDLLLDLVIARQILTLVLFEFRHRNMPSPPAYVSDDQPGIIANLRQLTELDRCSFNQALREAR